MKKLIFIIFVTLNTVANAKNAIPQLATDITPLLIGEKNPNYILKSSENKDLSVSGLIKAFGIAFEAQENYKSILDVHYNGLNACFLPVPSVFGVNPDGEILLEYVSPDFKHHITSELLVSVLKLKLK
ncbi:MAG: hypothetical protein ABI793_16880 [Flavobacterium sp.]